MISSEKSKEDKRTYKLLSVTALVISILLIIGVWLWFEKKDHLGL